MTVFIEKHIQGYCLVNSETYFSIAEGEPHNRGTLYFSKKKDAEEYAKTNNMEIK